MGNYSFEFNLLVCLCVVNPQIDGKPDVKANENFLLIVMRQSSNRPSFQFSKIPLQSRRSIWSVLLISVPAASCVKKNISSLVSLIGKCYSVWDALTSITSLPLCHWRFADGKGTENVRADVFCEHLLRPVLQGWLLFWSFPLENPQMCVCDWNNFFLWDPPDGFSQG